MSKEVNIMYCDFVKDYDCSDINSYHFFEVLNDGLYCLFDEGYINDVQFDNLVFALNKLRSKNL